MLPSAAAPTETSGATVMWTALSPAITVRSPPALGWTVPCTAALVMVLLGSMSQPEMPWRTLEPGMKIWMAWATCLSAGPLETMPISAPGLMSARVADLMLR